MEGMLYTFHDFMVHTKGVTYILAVLALIGITGFWLFLTAEDDEENETPSK